MGYISKSALERVIINVGMKPNVADRVRRMTARVGIEDGAAIRGYHPTITLRRMRTQYGIVGLGSLVRKHGREILEFIPPEYIRKKGRRKYVGLAHLQTVEHFYYEAKEASEGVG